MAKIDQVQPGTKVIDVSSLQDNLPAECTVREVKTVCGVRGVIIDNPDYTGYFKEYGEFIEADTFELEFNIV